MGDSEEPVRRSWHGLNQRKPKLPYYFRTSKRLKGLDEFEPPAWKGRVRFNDDPVTFGGVVRETIRFLIGFAVVGVLVAAFWVWLYGPDACPEILAGFKMGWC